MAFSAFCSAQTTYTWQGGAVGDYQLPASWTPARTAPAISDILAFNATFDISVTNVPNQTVQAIRIQSGTNTVSFATNVVTNVLSVSGTTPLVYTTAGSILAADRSHAFTVLLQRYVAPPLRGTYHVTA